MILHLLLNNIINTKKIISILVFFIIMFFIFFQNDALSLPSKNLILNDYGGLKEHPFLIVPHCIGCQPYKNLTNNKTLIFTIYAPDEESISIITDDCGGTEGEQYNLYGIYPQQIPCLEKLDEEFKSNTDEKLLKILNYIYKDSNLINDLKNAKLIKQGFRYFYFRVTFNESNEKNLLKKPIGEKLYVGKEYDYLISYYRITIMRKKLIDSHNKSKIQNIINELDEDLKLKNKIEQEIKQKKLNEDKKKVINID